MKRRKKEEEEENIEDVFIRQRRRRVSSRLSNGDISKQHSSDEKKSFKIPRDQLLACATLV